MSDSEVLFHVLCKEGINILGELNIMAAGFSPALAAPCPYGTSGHRRNEPSEMSPIALLKAMGRGDEIALIPLVGEHTREALSEFGITQLDIERALTSGVAEQSSLDDRA